MSVVTFIVVVIVGIFSFRTIGMKREAESYEKELAKLEQQYEDEVDRSRELEEKEKYMQTKKFVEEYAQEKLGLVYDNQIIFKSAEK